MKQTKKLYTTEKKYLTSRGRDPSEWRAKARFGHTTILVNTRSGEEIAITKRI
jgi:hypothetical protein